MFSILGIFLWLVNCAIAAKLARDRGRNSILWATLSLLGLGPLGPLIVLSLPAKTSISSMSVLASGISDVTTPTGPRPSIIARVALVALAVLLVFGIARLLISPTTPSALQQVGSDQPSASPDVGTTTASHSRDMLRKELEKARRTADAKGKEQIDSLLQKLENTGQKVEK